MHDIRTEPIPLPSERKKTGSEKCRDTEKAEPRERRRAVQVAPVGDPLEQVGRVAKARNLDAVLRDM